MRKIIHFDLDAFFCAVEEQRDASLRTKPFAVGGQPQSRGVVASCSYAARQFGIHSAMPMAQAVKRCPQLIIVPARHKVYRQRSQQVMALLHQLTSLVEQLSIDEAFLDVSARAEPAAQLARQLQVTVRKALDMPASLGVATNKLVAKVATDVGKAAAQTGHAPNAIQVVPPGEEAVFLAPLPVTALWGVGPKTAERLLALGIHTIGDVARWDEVDLMRRFGKVGHDLHRRAQGIDERPIVTSREAKSISQETTFAQDVDDRDKLHQVIRAQAAGVGRRLRQDNLAGVTVKLKLRWPDFTTQTRQTTLAHPINDDDEITRTALALFAENWQPGQPVRLIGVGVSGLGPPMRQMSLWDLPQSEAERRKADRLNDTVMALRKRFGDDAIRPASQLPEEG